MGCSVGRTSSCCGSPLVLLLACLLACLVTVRRRLIGRCCCCCFETAPVFKILERVGDMSSSILEFKFIGIAKHFRPWLACCCLRVTVERWWWTRNSFCSLNWSELNWSKLTITTTADLSLCLLPTLFLLMLWRESGGRI